MGQKVTISLALDVKEDRDILRWLGRQEKGQRSAAIRKAIREAMGQGGVTLGDVYQAVKAVERRLEGQRIGTDTRIDEGQWEEPPEAKAALDALGQV